MFRRETGGKLVGEVQYLVLPSSWCRVYLRLNFPAPIDFFHVMHLPHPHYWLFVSALRTIWSLSGLFLVCGSSKSESTVQ